MLRISWPLAFLILALPFLELARTQPLEHSLPETSARGGSGIWTVMAARRSTRTFGTEPISETALGQLLWAGQGVVDGHRTTPSAGALYPLTIHVFDARGVWRYLPNEHRLRLEGMRDRRADLSVAALRQLPVRDAATTIVISADIPLVASKYGTRSATRFATLEAGHAAQNILLAATALDLAAVPIGAFDEAELRRVLALPDQMTPLYMICTGKHP